MTPKIPIFIADAFVGVLGNRILRGNPAAVALLDAPHDAAWMQEVAAEMNLSETAFLVQKDVDNFDLRWFTPTCEVDLCGHATLASAHILWECGRLDASQNAHFHTLSGVLTAQKRGERIALDFPSQEVEPRDVPLALRASLRLRDENQPISAFRAADDWLLQLESADLSQIRPDFAAMGQWCHDDGARGVIVTARGPKNGEVDFMSRFFGPAVGVDEDPVTGSAHTKLAPFWSKKLGKLQMLGFQASPRGGIVGVRCRENRVILSGQSRMVLRGELFI